MNIEIATRETTCRICYSPLKGRQTIFCSRKCKGRYHQSYVSQQDRGLQRKLSLVQEFGGRCTMCGYATNLAAFAFHHRDPATKLFQLDLRSLSNRTMETIRYEAKKCELVCANCHAELHHPNLDMANVGTSLTTLNGEGNPSHQTKVLNK